MDESILFVYIILIVKPRSTDGDAEALNTAHFTQYSPRSISSRAVLCDLGGIEGRGRLLRKCSEHTMWNLTMFQPADTSSILKTDFEDSLALGLFTKWAPT